MCHQNYPSSAALGSLSNIRTHCGRPVKTMCQPWSRSKSLSIQNYLFIFSGVQTGYVCATQPRATRRSFICVSVLSVNTVVSARTGWNYLSCRLSGPKAGDYLRGYVSEHVNAEWRLSLVSGDPGLPHHSAPPPFRSATGSKPATGVFFFFFLLSAWRLSPIMTKIRACWHFLNEAVWDLSAASEIRGWGFAVNLRSFDIFAVGDGNICKVT